jgi:hypothetical protein
MADMITCGVAFFHEGSITRSPVHLVGARFLAAFGSRYRVPASDVASWSCLREDEHFMVLACAR